MDAYFTKPDMSILPKTDILIGHERFVGFNRKLLKDIIKELLNIARADISGYDYGRLIEEIEHEYNKRISGGLKKVINASGVIVHTNLGRAPIGYAGAMRAVGDVLGYCNLEYDIATGVRGDRYSHMSNMITILTSAEDAVVVNNNAAAVYLIANTFAKGASVIISRGELIEIGGQFRIPDVLISAGAKLKEIGTTNKTYIRDYESAISDDTKIVMKLSKSNYKISGFAEDVSWRDIAKIKRPAKLPVYYDAGSGVFDKSAATPNEPAAAEYIKAGLDIVSFSGDKLFGSVQSGIIFGRKRYINLLKKNPLMRMLRPDKFTLAILSAALKDAVDGKKQYLEELLSENLEDIRTRAAKIISIIKEETGKELIMIETVSKIGGGIDPDAEVPDYAIIIDDSHGNITDIAYKLRVASIPAVIGSINNGRLYIYLRAVGIDDTHALAMAISGAIC